MNTLKLYPVYTNDEELPEDKTYYVVAKNGTFLHKKTAFGRCFVPANIPWTQENCLWINYDLPPVPHGIMSKALTFFRKVFKIYRSESALILYYHPENGYNLFCPEQYVSYGSVSYKRNERPENYGNTVGTIHSHCDFSAFHSSTDEADEADFDGLHMTFGNVDQESFSISASLVSNDHRVLINPTDYCEGITNVQGNRLFTLNSNEFIDHSIVSEWINNKVHKRSGRF